ncbi:putative nuclease HARBI1 isoform X1 [Anthonomus grandis grandis]|uniref:putative nuclease HARBI1 isoform X1 n=1 Tax=Anthonomus grandis grandis TaxID=2921223 RepID=UPI0021666156|nr:putative nuclease HARBI1 isoform X1 [Anthonomus grandis grandis]
MYFRVTKEELDFLHGLVKEHIKKQNTQFRRAISTEERLAVCLRYLATGNSFRSMGFSYRLGFSTVREIVIEVCDAIWKNLGPIVMPTLMTEIWKKSAARFCQIWDFPHCIAAIDGKHVNIQCPINAGSTYYNYKGSHSIVLLVLVDADYKFIAIDVGSYGRNSDGGIFEKSKIGKKLQNRTLGVPGDTPLEANVLPQSHVILGDEAFPLKTYLLRSYSRFYLGENEPNKVYNYRLSRARRTVEYAFGILVSRWRVFLRHFEIQPDFVDKVVVATCCLHNMLSTESMEPDLSTLRSPKAALLNIQEIRRNHANAAFRTREAFKEYFNSSTGSVPWQIGMVGKGRIYNEND